MGQVDCFTLAGLECWFNSDDHLPHHIHVQKGSAWEIRVYFLKCVEKNLDFDTKWQSAKKGPSSKELKLILAAVLENRERLLDEWTAKVKRDAQHDD